MTSVASCSSPTSSLTRPPGATSKPLRLSCRPTVSPCAIMSTPCASSASSRGETASGASTSCKPTKLILSGNKSCKSWAWRSFTLSRLRPKGKVERPYRWMQDRIVRTCALESISSLDEVRSVLKEEVDRYNNHQVHSTTGEIPTIRFARARQEANSLFRPFALPKPYTSPKDVFCLREKRQVNAYNRISLLNREIQVPNVPLREEVEVHMVPNVDKQLLELRIWWNKQMVHSVAFPLQGIRVHF